MKLQKHAAEALERIRAIARDCDIEVTFGGTTHYRVRLSRAGRYVGTVGISCSPKNRDACVREVERAARRVLASAA